MTKRMVIMLVAVGVLFGGIFGYKAFTAHMMKKFMESAPMPPVVVSTVTAASETWQPQLKAAGSFRAVRGVDVAGEVSGIVRTVHFRSGDEIKAGEVLIQLNADADIAQLRALEAAAELAQTIYERDKKQLAAQAVSQATLDADAAELKSKKAQQAQQAALVEKKTLRAPFAGRLGISAVNPGQYVNPGDKLVTLQALDTLFVDFYLPQQELSRVSVRQTVVATIDTYPGKTFTGTITAINPTVDPQTRNFQVEAMIKNHRHELLPGMYGTVEVLAGSAQRYLTIPRTAVTFNPYGETVYIVEKKAASPDVKPVLSAKQTFVTIGPTRGDQVAILAGIKEGELVVTSGQLKLKSGSQVIIDNRVQPSSDADPRPADQ